MSNLVTSLLGSTVTISRDDHHYQYHVVAVWIAGNHNPYLLIRDRGGRLDAIHALDAIVIPPKSGAES